MEKGNTMGCPGVHCDGCGKGSISTGAVALVIGAIVIATHKTAIEHGVGEAVQATLIIVTAVIGMAILSSIAVIAYVVRSHRRDKLMLSQRLRDRNTQLNGIPNGKVISAEVIRPKAIASSRKPWPSYVQDDAQTIEIRNRIVND